VGVAAESVVLGLLFLRLLQFAPVSNIALWQQQQKANLRKTNKKYT
jgi:hypothetical protein